MEENENLVPEITAANPDGGAENLNADPISPATHESIDSLLDEAERETGVIPETEHQPTTSNEDTTTLDSISGTENKQNNEITPEPFQSGTEVSEPKAGVEVQASSVQEQKTEIDPEILAIEQPRNLSEKNQNNWRKLQETASEYKKQAAEAQVLRERLAEAEKRPAQTPEDYEELKKFRQIFDIKNDPEFQSKYTQPINAAKENIYAIMRKNGASDDVIASIEKAGGPDKIDDKWWQQNALSKLGLTDAEKLKRNLIDVADLKEKQEGEIAYAAENAEKILEQRQNQSNEWYENETTNIRNHVEELTKEIPWARYQATPENATQEQIEKIQKHNQVVQSLETKFNSALWPQNANERASVAAAAVYSHVLTNQLQIEQNAKAALEAQVKKLTDENSKLKSSGKMPKQSVNTPSTIKNNDLNSRIKMSASDAIDLGLDEAGA